MREILSFRCNELDMMIKKDEIGYSSVQRWQTGHNRLEITKLRVFTVQRWRTGHNSKQKGRFGCLSFRGDELDITDWEATKLEILSFRGDELDMMTKWRWIWF